MPLPLFVMLVTIPSTDMKFLKSEAAAAVDVPGGVEVTGTLFRGYIALKK
jgi:hypothetical protein